MKKVPPPDFAGYLDAANHGRVNKALTEEFGEVVQTITSNASEHGTLWKGEMTVKIKLSADKFGKVTAKFTSSHSWESIPLPGADMYYDPDSGALLEQEPRQLKIEGFDDGVPQRKVKAADAPKTRTEE